MKTKILLWLKTTQKATAALAGAAGVLASATFLPAPYGQYVAIAGVILTWLLTYVFPYVQKTVETFPEAWEESGHDGIPASEWGGWNHTIEHVDAPLEGEIIEPETDKIARIDYETAGIPVIVDDSQREFVPPFTGAISVDEVLRRLAEEAKVAV